MRQQIIYLFSLLLLIGLSACEPTIDSRGYVADETVESQIIVGMSSRRDVQALLGSPSSASTFGDQQWYYMRSTKERVAFLEPEIIAQQIMQIDFDENGIVEEIDHYTLEDGQKVAIVDKVTPTEGHSLGFFEQILGNVGRFNQPAGVGN